MSFFSSLYDKLLNAIVDEDKMKEYKTNNNNTLNDDFLCNLCEKDCHELCNCRCHFSSCTECDKKSCDLKSCGCNCHNDDKLYSNNRLNESNNFTKETAPQAEMLTKQSPAREAIKSEYKPSNLRTNSMIKQDSLKKSHNLEEENPKPKFNNFNLNNDEGSIRKSSNDINSIGDRIIKLQVNESMSMRSDLMSNEPTKISNFEGEEVTQNQKKLSKSISKGKNLEIKINNDPKKSEKEKGKDKDQIKDKKNSVVDQNKDKKNAGIEKENTLDSKDSQEKVVRRRQSKYASMLSKDIVVDDDMNDLLNRGISDMMKSSMISRCRGKNIEDEKRILKFGKSKSKDKRITIDDYNEEQKDLDLIKHSLAKKLKGNFEKNKLQNMQMPNINDGKGENRFIREKTDLTKGMNHLQNQLYLENYNDINKLSARVFEDFEKQTSWQSYTTLLIADIKDEKKEMMKLERIEKVKEKK